MFQDVSGILTTLFLTSQVFQWSALSLPQSPCLAPRFQASWTSSVLYLKELLHFTLAMAGRGGAARSNGPAAGNKICQFKLVLLGESAVGKSSLVLRFVKGQFHEYQESTIGGKVAGLCTLYSVTISHFTFLVCYSDQSVYLFLVYVLCKFVMQLNAIKTENVLQFLPNHFPVHVGCYES